MTSLLLSVCQCGCNQGIDNRKYYKSKYLKGHNNRGKNHPKYKEGLPKNGNYRKIKRPHHKFAMKSGYVLFHRYLKELRHCNL